MKKHTEQSSFSLERFRSREDCGPGSRERVVLVGSGAFSPVHRNHLRFFEALRAYFESETGAIESVRGPHPEREGFPKAVVGLVVSPLPDRMVAKKRESSAPRAHRVAMLELAARECPGLTVVHEELHGARLLAHVHERVSAHVRGSVRVVAVTGSDGYGASTSFLPDEIALACVRRTGFDGEWTALCSATRASARRVFLVEDNHQPVAFSATEARALLRESSSSVQRAALEQWMPPAVVSYALEHALFETKEPGA